MKVTRGWLLRRFDGIMPVAIKLVITLSMHVVTHEKSDDPSELR